MLRKSVEIACEARSTYYDKCKATSSSSDIVDDKILKTRPILVAASVGSYGAYLADGSEYRFLAALISYTVQIFFFFCLLKKHYLLVTLSVESMVI